jgi:2-phospho-L-lactate/phosphoenolpyruvate guanylyltransferase
MMPAVSSPKAPYEWQVVVPVRGGAVGKSRLRSIEGHVLTDIDRRDLALAMARDTVSAAVASARGPVLVLTADEAVQAMAADCGASVAPDGGRGLNAELACAVVALPPADGVCVLLGDLPAIRPADLAEALDQAGSTSAHGVVVPDWEGTGTTLVALAPGRLGRAGFCFGPDSARRHRQAGLREVGLHLVRLRSDVDTAQAWDRAVRLGLGPATTALRHRLLGLRG